MRTLIFMKESDLQPSGGPAGYCYNIQQELLKQNINQVEFLPAENSKKVVQVELYRKLASYLPKWVNAAQIAYRRKRDYQKMITAPQRHNIDFGVYDVVHFHSTTALYKYRKDLEDYSGKIILTTHSPVPQHQEIYAELPTELEKKIYRNFYAKLELIDAYAFARADYVIYPCMEAEESYLKNWKQYAQIHKELDKKGKLVYIPTGIIPKKVVHSRQEVCEEQKIDDKRFIVCYAGRHNKVKGYDLLQDIATELWKRNNDFQFVICGKEAPLLGLKDVRWTEIGWTRDSQSIIAASDVFVLPNRETYFDIVMLEVLSCGKIVVASRTGGNKYFERIQARGVFLYDTIEEAVGIIEGISHMTAEQRKELEVANMALFSEHFTTDRYVRAYMKFLATLESK